MVNSEGDPRYQQDAFERGRSPEGIPNTTLDSWLNRRLNSEIKIAVLSSMRPGMTYSVNELYNLLPHELIQRGLPEEGQAGWIMGEDTPTRYCKDSFIPAGFVVKEQKASSKYGSIAAYRKTDVGIEMGDALGGILAHYSLTHPDVSLSRLMGAGGHIRRRILEAAINQQGSPLRTAEMAEIVGVVSSSVGMVAKEMDKIGLVRYNAPHYHTPITAYKLAPGASDEGHVYQSYAYTLLVARTLAASPDRFWTIGEITDIVAQEQQRSLGRELNEDERAKAHDQARKALGTLRNRGYATQENFAPELLTPIIIPEEMQTSIEDFVRMIDAFQRQDATILQLGANMSRQLREDPELLTRLILKGRHTSPHAGRTREVREETYNTLLATVRAHSEADTRQLADILHREHSILLTQPGVAQYLARLRNRGVVVSRLDERGALRWKAV